MFIDTTILLIRHGEKPGDSELDAADDGPNLSSQGWQRAEAYIEYFNHYVAVAVGGTHKRKPVAIDYVFAAADNYQTSYRPRLTVSPFADQKTAPRPLSAGIADKDYVDLYQQLGKSDYDRKEILICWHHGAIIDLATCLLTANGARDVPPLTGESCWPTKHAKWPPTVFGWLLQICFDSKGRPDVGWTRCLNEGLMPWDTQDPCNGWLS